MDRETAMGKYIENLKQIIETMNFNADVERFMEVKVQNYSIHTDHNCSFRPWDHFMSMLMRTKSLLIVLL